MQLLLASGADIFLNDSVGTDAASIIKANGNDELFGMILASGTKALFGLALFLELPVGNNVVSGC